MTSRDVLTDAEFSVIWDLRERWLDARQRKDWPAADALRADLLDRGLHGADLMSWLPVFESTAARQRRLTARETQE